MMSLEEDVYYNKQLPCLVVGIRTLITVTGTTHYLDWSFKDNLT